MNTTALVLAVHTALTPLVAAAGGTLDLARSFDEAHAFLSSAPSRWRVVLVWGGYASHPQAREGMTYHSLTTILQAPNGLARDRGTRSLSLTDQIETLSAWMRAMRFPDGWQADSAGFSLESSNWIASTAQRFSSHALNWQIEAALPGFTHHIIIPPPTP